MIKKVTAHIIILKIIFFFTFLVLAAFSGVIFIFKDILEFGSIPFILFFIFPHVLVFTSCLIILRIFNKKKSLKSIINEEHKITTSFVSVQVVSNVRIGVHSPFVILTDWWNCEDGEIYTFKSEYLNRDPSSLIESLGVNCFDVYLDKHNLKKYYMDIDELLKQQ